MADGNVITKFCPKCKETKGADAFTASRRRPDGLRGWCRSCCTICARARYQADPERHAGRLRAYRAANRDNFNAWQRSNIAIPSNREKRRAKYRAWFSANKALYKLIKNKYERANPHAASIRRAKRRARLRDAPGSHTGDDIKAIGIAQKWRCAYCRESIIEKFEVDHITALSRGGSNDRRNLQLTCGPCNGSKHAKDPIDYAQGLGRLL